MANRLVQPMTIVVILIFFVFFLSSCSAPAPTPTEIFAQEEEVITEDVEIMLDFYNEMGGKPEATVINSGQKLPMINQSLLNALMIRALDFNDIYWDQDPSHPSDIIPAALTPAEVLNKYGKDLITAIVLAYEWEMRLCEFAIAGIRERKWHHATLTQLASPLVAGKILDRIVGIRLTRRRLGPFI